MADDEFLVKLTRDQALVLSDWLHTMIGSAEFDSLVDRDRAAWSPIHRIAGSLETTLPEIFMPDYRSRLAAARERLLETLGEAD